MPPNTKPCIYCRSQIDEEAIVCPTCGRSQVLRRWARVFASPLPRVLEAVGAGIVILLISMLYQYRAESVRERGDRAEKLAASGIKIQILTEELQRPCLSDSENECSRRYSRLVADFSENAYAFKQEARALAQDHDIKHAIAFIDDFFNPGAIDLSEVDAMPLQMQMLTSQPVLSRPYDSDQWCSVETQRQMHWLMLSINVYRYCYVAVRAYFSELSRESSDAFWAPEVPATPSPRYLTCIRALREAGEDGGIYAFEDKINDVAAAIDYGRNVNYTAPWNYHSFCPTARDNRGWESGIIPPGTAQLVVVTTAGWSSDEGALRRFQRTDAGWQQVAEPVPVRLGSNGMGWGRGVHSHGVVTARAPREPIKHEGDRRSPAGVFALREVFAIDRLELSTRMPLHRVEDGMACEDRSSRAAYNRAIELGQAEIARCEREGRCPEFLRREDGVYDLFVWVDHNTNPTVENAGSCIFLHIDHADRRPTAGCTSLARADLRELVEWLDPEQNPLLVQMPEQELTERLAKWGLPRPSWLN